jgi:hypothetical protein
VRTVVGGRGTSHCPRCQPPSTDAVTNSQALADKPQL